MKKDITKEKEEVEKFFNKHKLSGIFLIPEQGTFAFFKNDTARLLILEHAEVERLARKKVLEMEADKIINMISTKRGQGNNTPSYLG